MSRFQVSADIRYLDGTLAGLVIPAGYRLTVPTQRRAQQIVSWLERVRSSRDFVRAARTSHRFEVVGGVSLTALAAGGAL